MKKLLNIIIKELKSPIEGLIDGPIEGLIGPSIGPSIGLSIGLPMVLCIDTSTSESGISLVSESESLGYLKLEQMNASEKILNNIDELLKKANVNLSDLNGIMVIKGPGSFTGLRVGISVANQFAHQLKIPIVGFRTDEWYGYRTDEKDFIYLQSMNRDQVYMVGFGKFGSKYPQSIISVSECHHELVAESNIKWVGQLSDAHLEQLSDLDEIKDVRNSDESWQKAAKLIDIKRNIRYNLIQPFYGKDPTITKSKKLNL